MLTVCLDIDRTLTPIYALIEELEYTFVLSSHYCLILLLDTTIHLKRRKVAAT